jgi:iron complex outermembrane receptor protein
MTRTSARQPLYWGLLTLAALATCALPVEFARAQSAAASSSTANSSGQTAPAATNKADSETQVLQEVVVTGTNEALRVLDTSYAVTKIDQDALKSTPALGLAALSQSVPGLYGEASAGEYNLNISPRGVRGGFLSYISVQEDGLPFIYNGFLEEMELRKDLTYDSLEVIRGGPSGVLTSNGAGAIMNFISRKAGPTPEGEVAVSYSDFHSTRADFFYGAPLSSTTSATFGGYWRVGDGVKDTGYQADHGGQFRGTLTHTLENGELFVSYKHIDDHTQFFLPQPVKITQVGGVQRISPIPGFDASTDYLAGPDTQNVGLKSPNGTNGNINLGDGIAEKSDTVTLRGIYDWHNGFRFKDTLRIAKINMVDNDLRNLGGNSQIFDATTFLATDPRVQALIAQFAPQGATHAQLFQVSTGMPITNPAAMNGNGLLTEMGSNQYTQSQDTVVNDAQVTFNSHNNDVALGLLSWNINMDVSQIGVNWLLDVTNRAHTIDVAAVTATGQVVGHLTDGGVLNYGEGYGNGTVHIGSNSLYLNDQWHPIDPLRIDGGVRYEKVNYQSTSENVASNVPLSGGALDPTIVADQTAVSYGTGTYTNGTRDLSGTAWTLGANYQLTRNFALYGRYSNAFDTGIANFAVFGPGNSVLPSQLTHLHFGEFGLRFSSEKFFAEVIGFRSVNENIGIATSNTGGQVFLNNVANGAEFNSKWIPFSVLSFDLYGVLQHSDITSVGGSSTFDGNQIDRLPNVEVHFTPTLSTPDHRLEGYATISYYGKRWGDLANTLELDPYTDLAAGIRYAVSPRVNLSVQGTNLTNKFSITEGNPRGNNVVAGTNAYGFARANLPRVVMFTIDARF